jgi:hypothetical protein
LFFQTSLLRSICKRGTGGETFLLPHSRNTQQFCGDGNALFKQIVWNVPVVVGKRGNDIGAEIRRTSIIVTDLVFFGMAKTASMSGAPLI